jgi:hypothetical protein
VSVGEVIGPWFDAVVVVPKPRLAIVMHLEAFRSQHLQLRDCWILRYPFCPGTKPDLLPNYVTADLP